MKYCIMCCAFLVASVTGCDWPWKAKETNASTNDQSGKWMIVAAISSTTNPYFGVWRINTQTGFMDFCYNNGGVSCNAPVAAPKTSDEIAAENKAFLKTLHSADSKADGDAFTKTFEEFKKKKALDEKLKNDPLWNVMQGTKK